MKTFQLTPAPDQTQVKRPRTRRRGPGPRVSDPQRFDSPPPRQILTTGPGLEILTTSPQITRCGRGRPRPGPLILLGALSALLFGFASNTLASDPIGVYAYVDKVVFEPNQTAPERVQVWGGFSLAEGRGYDYAAAKRGFMYFQIVPGKETVCRNEWNDLHKVAGSGQIVTFGSRYKPNGTIRAADAKAENPDPYPIGFGLTKVKDGPNTSDYKPIRELRVLRDDKKKAPPGSSSSPAKGAGTYGLGRNVSSLS